MAEELTSYYVNYGDWRKMFTGYRRASTKSPRTMCSASRSNIWFRRTRTVAYTIAPAGRQRPPKGEGQ